MVSCTAAFAATWLGPSWHAQWGHRGAIRYDEMIRWYGRLRTFCSTWYTTNVERERNERTAKDGSCHLQALDDTKMHSSGLILRWRCVRMRSGLISGRGTQHASGIRAGRLKASAAGLVVTRCTLMTGKDRFHAFFNGWHASSANSGCNQQTALTDMTAVVLPSCLAGLMLC